MINRSIENVIAGLLKQATHCAYCHRGHRLLREREEEECFTAKTVGLVSDNMKGNKH